ncbi:hypothetical protein ScPMuIL_012437 [Solemya velum]
MGQHRHADLGSQRAECQLAVTNRVTNGIPAEEREEMVKKRLLESDNSAKTGVSTEYQNSVLKLEQLSDNSLSNKPVGDMESAEGSANLDVEQRTDDLEPPAGDVGGVESTTIETTETPDILRRPTIDSTPDRPTEQTVPPEDDDQMSSSPPKETLPCPSVCTSVPVDKFQLALITPLPETPVVPQTAVKSFSTSENIGSQNTVQTLVQKLDECDLQHAEPDSPTIGEAAQPEAAIQSSKKGIESMDNSNPPADGNSETEIFDQFRKLKDLALVTPLPPTPVAVQCHTLESVAADDGQEDGVKQQLIGLESMASDDGQEDGVKQQLIGLESMTADDGQEDGVKQQLIGLESMTADDGQEDGVKQQLIAVLPETKVEVATRVDGEGDSKQGNTQTPETKTKNSPTASNKDIVTMATEFSEEGLLVFPKKLIYELGYKKDLASGEMESIIQKQYQIALSTKNLKWISEARYFAEVLFSRTWIDEHLPALNKDGKQKRHKERKNKKQQEKNDVYLNDGYMYKDVRLKTNPHLQSLCENVGPSTEHRQKPYDRPPKKDFNRKTSSDDMSSPSPTKDQGAESVSSPKKQERTEHGLQKQPSGDRTLSNKTEPKLDVGESPLEELQPGEGSGETKVETKSDEDVLLESSRRDQVCESISIEEEGVPQGKLDSSEDVPQGKLNSSEGVPQVKLDSSESVPQAKLDSSEGVPQAKLHSSEGVPQAKLVSSEDVPQAKLDIFEGVSQAKLDSFEGVPQAKLESSEAVPQGKLESSEGVPQAMLESSERVPGTKTVLSTESEEKTNTADKDPAFFKSDIDECINEVVRSVIPRQEETEADLDKASEEIVMEVFDNALRQFDTSCVMDQLTDGVEKQMEPPSFRAECLSTVTKEAEADGDGTCVESRSLEKMKTDIDVDLRD